MVLEKTLESPLDCKEIQPVHPKRRSVLGVRWKDWCRSWNSNTLATWCEEPPHWKRLWCWARLKVEGEGDDRGWDGWMASLTQWTWIWVISGSCWWTGEPGVLQSVEVAKSRTRLCDWNELILKSSKFFLKLIILIWQINNDYCGSYRVMDFFANLL